MFGFRICTGVHLTLISSLQDFGQNQNLETILICIVVLCFPHNHIAWIRMCDEYTRSIALTVCHKLYSMLWPHEQVCSRTIKYQIVFLLLWSDGHRGMALRLCIAVELFCSPVRNIFRASLHEVSLWLLFLFFHSSSRSSVIIHDIPANLTFSLSSTQINMVKEWCWFSQINVFHEYFPHWVNIVFLSSQFYIVPRIAFSHNSPAKGWPYRFRSRRTTGCKAKQQAKKDDFWPVTLERTVNPTSVKWSRNATQASWPSQQELANCSYKSFAEIGRHSTIHWSFEGIPNRLS